MNQIKSSQINFVLIEIENLNPNIGKVVSSRQYIHIYRKNKFLLK